MKVKELIKILADIDPHSEIYIDVGRTWFLLEESHIKQPSVFSSNKNTTIDVSSDLTERGYIIEQTN